MEALGLGEALESMGDTLLLQASVTQGSLVSMLSSAGVSFANKSKLLKSLTTPASPVSVARCGFVAAFMLQRPVRAYLLCVCCVYVGSNSSVFVIAGEWCAFLHIFRFRVTKL